MNAILTPAGKCTRTAVCSEFARLPSPSCPRPPCPQAYRLPLASRAYCAVLDELTPTTWPGRFSRVGRRLWPAGSPSPVNVPQCAMVTPAGGGVAAAGTAAVVTLRPATAATLAAVASRVRSVVVPARSGTVEAARAQENAEPAAERGETVDCSIFPIMYIENIDKSRQVSTLSL